MKLFFVLFSMVMVLLGGSGCTGVAEQELPSTRPFYESLKHKLATCIAVQAKLGNDLSRFFHFADDMEGEPNRLTHSYNLTGFRFEQLKFWYEYVGAGSLQDGDQSAGCTFEQDTESVISAWYDYGPKSKKDVVIKLTPLTDPNPENVKREWSLVLSGEFRGYTYLLGADLELR